MEFEKNNDEKKVSIGQRPIEFLVLDEKLENYISKTWYFLFKISEIPRLAHYTIPKILQKEFLSSLIMWLSNYHILNLFIPEALILYPLISKELYLLAIFPKMPVST